MRTTKYFFLTAFALSTLGISANAAEGKLKMAVLDFKTVGDSRELGNGAAEILRTTLLETGRYVLVERNMLNQVLKEQKLGASGTVDQTTAVGIGKILGAQVVTVGSVVKLGNTFTLNVRFVDVHTGEVLSGKKLTAKSTDDIPGLCNQMVKIFSKREPPPQHEPQTKPRPKPAPLPKPVARTEKPPPVFKREAGPETWAAGAIYPGASIKRFLSNRTAWELRGQSGSGILAIGPRYYRYFSATAAPKLYWGLEADYIGFKGEQSKGAGYAAGGFVGGEIMLGDKLGLAMDFGPMYISLADSEYSQSASNLEYVLNMAIYWHFR